MKKSRSHHTDVPDFLHNSPFFIPELHDFKSDQRVKLKKKPTLLEILKSKSSRFVAYVILTIIAFFYLRHKARQARLWDHLTGPSRYYQEAVQPPVLYGDDETNWSDFAYALYATDTEYLCNTVMLFETLHRLGSKADRILLYPRGFDMNARSESLNTELLLRAENEYNVKLIPIDIQHNRLASCAYPFLPRRHIYLTKADAGPNWADSYTKLLAFNQTQYKRLLVLDSDSTLLSHMDELFFLPPSPIALPRAYWLAKPTLSSHIMLITPSLPSFALISAAITDARSRLGVYDMDIINSLFGSHPSCQRLPHRPYALLTGEFRRGVNEHELYLYENDAGNWDGDEKLEWNPDAAIMEAKFVHFSDYPMAKPWIVKKNRKGEYGKEPQCFYPSDTSTLNCKARLIWVDLYDDFKKRRKVCCCADDEERILLTDVKRVCGM